MKLKIITLSVLGLFTTHSWGQTLLYNDGATVKIQAGATLYVEGGVQNTATGTIDNDGVIEITGDFENLGTWDPNQPNTLKFSGNTASNVTSAIGVAYQDVVIAKTGANVVLLSNMTINDSLVFSGSGVSQLAIGTNNLKMGSSSKVGGHDSDEFVLTDGSGAMKRSFASFESFEYPVGFTSTTYNPATINVTAGPSDTFSVRVLVSPTDGDGLTGTAITADVVDAVWDIKETVAGGNTADITLGWQESDELTGFNDALNAVSRNDGVSGWDALFADLGPEVGNTRTRTSLSSFGAFAVGGELIGNALTLNTKVFLQGGYSAGQHTDLLRTLSLIPLNEPYGQPPFNQAPFNFAHVGYGGGESVPSVATFDQAGTSDDIVDWVAVEIRNSVTPGTVLATKSALIQRDGHIVDLDGTSNLKVYGLADGTYHVRINHRNHLGVRTQTALALGNSVTNLDFTAAGFAFDNGSSINEPMVDLGGGIMGMWTGDATGDKKVRVTPLASPPFTQSDRTFILNNALGGNPNGQLNGYDRSDINLDGKVRVTPLASPPFTPSDATIILNSVLGGDPNKQVSEHN